MENAQTTDRAGPLLNNMLIMFMLAMILALVPLGAAISGSGDQMLQPLAIAIISGLIVQVPLALIVLPALYYLLSRGAPAPRGPDMSGE